MTPTHEEFTTLVDDLCRSYFEMRSGEHVHHFEKNRAFVLDVYRQVCEQRDAAEADR